MKYIEYEYEVIDNKVFVHITHQDYISRGKFTILHSLCIFGERYGLVSLSHCEFQIGSYRGLYKIIFFLQGSNSKTHKANEYPPEKLIIPRKYFSIFKKLVVEYNLLRAFKNEISGL